MQKDNAESDVKVLLLKPFLSSSPPAAAAQKRRGHLMSAPLAYLHHLNHRLTK